MENSEFLYNEIVYYQRRLIEENIKLTFWKEKGIWKCYSFYDEFASDDTTILKNLKKIQSKDSKAIIISKLDLIQSLTSYTNGISLAVNIIEYKYNNHKNNIKDFITHYKLLLRQPKMQNEIDIQNLLQSQFGKSIQKIAKGFGEAIKSENDKDVIYYDEIWEICKSALEFMYEERFDFIYSHDYYGIYMTKADEWLIKTESTESNRK